MNTSSKMLHPIIVAGSLFGQFPLVCTRARSAGVVELTTDDGLTEVGDNYCVRMICSISTGAVVVRRSERRSLPLRADPNLYVVSRNCTLFDARFT